MSKTGNEELTESISSDTKETHEKTCKILLISNITIYIVSFSVCVGDDDDVQDTKKQKEKCT